MIMIDLFEQSTKRTPTEIILVKAAKYLYSEIGSDSGDLEYAAFRMMKENYIDFDERINSGDYDKYNTRVFKQALKEYCSDEAEWKYEELMRLFHGTELPIWRMITAPKDWQPAPDVHPGIYWSWDENAAEAHWGEFGNGDVEWLLHAEASYNDIDWVETIVKNCHSSYQAEKEITLLGKPIKLLDYHIV